MAISVTHFTDPGCPWAYSASPALAALAWRYGDQLDWRLATIGLTEQAEQYLRRGYSPGPRRPRLHDLPPALGHAVRDRAARPRLTATARACRAIVATRLRYPDREYAVFRALQFGWMTTPLVMDEEDDILRAIEGVPGIDAREIVARARRPRRRRRLRGRPRRRAHRRGQPDPLPGQGRADRRPRPLHRPVAHLHPGRPAPRGGRLPADRGLRRDRRQPRPDARPGARRPRTRSRRWRRSRTAWSRPRSRRS